MLDLDNDVCNLTIANNMVQTNLKSKEPYTVCVIPITDSDGKEHSYNAWKFAYDKWKFDSSEIYVLYNEGVIRKQNKTYMMTPETYRLVDKEKRKIARREKRAQVKENAQYAAEVALRGVGYAALAGTCICVASVVVVGVLYGLDRWAHDKQYKIDKQVQEYKLTLPDWNDSVVRATDDESLRRALDKREQALVQVEHFRDSLERVYGK